MSPLRQQRLDDEIQRLQGLLHQCLAVNGLKAFHVSPPFSDEYLFPYF